FERIAKGEERPKQRRGGRRRENLTLEQEMAFLRPFFDEAKTGGILVVSPIKTALEARLGRQSALSCVYRLLPRHGWRKLAPDKRHPQSDPAVQATWKKNSPRRSPRSPKHSRGTVPFA